MFEFKLDLDAALKNNLGGTGVRSGVYKIKIDAIPFEIKNGTPVASLNATTLERLIEGEDGTKGWDIYPNKNVTVFNLALTPKDANGKERFNYSATMELLALAGVRTGQRVQKTVGKKTQKLMEVFVEAENKEVIVVIKGMKDYYNGKETYQLRLLKTFAPTGQSLAELQAGKPAAEIYEIEIPEDGETEAYKAWVAAGKPQDASDITSQVAGAMPEIPGMGEMPTFGAPAAPEQPTQPTQPGADNGQPVNLFG